MSLSAAALAAALLFQAAARAPDAAAPEPPQSRVEVGWDPATGRGDVRHFFENGDLARISAPIDFLGVNNYTRQIVRANPNGGAPVKVYADGAQHTEMRWEVSPDGLHDLLLRLRDDYAPAAIYVTESGAAFGDVREHDGSVHDPERQEYLASYVDAVGRAIEEGVPVKGYLVWSLLDNFEWAEGYSKRFGLVYVDYPTLERVPKASFNWYRDFIVAQRAPGSVTAATGPG